MVVGRQRLTPRISSQKENQSNPQPKPNMTTVYEIALKEGKSPNGNSFIAAAVLLTSAFVSRPPGWVRACPPPDMGADELTAAFKEAGVSVILTYPDHA